MVIDCRNKKKTKILEFCITCIGWLYLVGFALHTIVSLILWYFNLSNIFYELFTLESVTDTLIIITITFFTAIIGFLIMYGWRSYNVRRFGSLKRRKFQRDVGIDDISNYFGLIVEEVIELQTNKWTDLEDIIT